MVRDTSRKTERLLTLVPLSSHCAIECNPNTRGTILELFLALQHPYIYPVLDLDFRDVSGQTYVILVLPFNNKGSLKDHIYKVRSVSPSVHGHVEACVHYTAVFLNLCETAAR